jgi:hypothetical protein
LLGKAFFFKKDYNFSGKFIGADVPPLRVTPVVFKNLNADK